MNDLVEEIQYLYVGVVKAKDVTAGSSCDPFVEVLVGNYKGTTRDFAKISNSERDHVFAFQRDRLQASILQVSVKDKDAVTKDNFMGWVLFNLTEVPKRVPPDSPLAPQWYRLEDRKGNKLKQELMLSVWWGTQADEAFNEAWHSDSAPVGEANGLANIRSKVYLSPKLWYLRLNVIEAQDLVPISTTTYTGVSVKATIGHQTLKTRTIWGTSVGHIWNEELMFVAAEPFDERLMLSVENKFASYDNKVVGKCAIHLLSVERRYDTNPINSRWFNLEKDVIFDGESKSVKFASKIHLRICLEGGYHVMDESTHCSSDLRPTVTKSLITKSIGVLEVGILSAHQLFPMKTKDEWGFTNAYCVAKYGRKWVRTRTVINSMNPKWNEQYTWEVFDPCTVITVGVFHNRHHQGGDKSEAKDSYMGKVRIRLSTLETDCVYSHAYPLLVLHPSGVKKMGELFLAVRFRCSSFTNMMHTYSKPLLPQMHYSHPLAVTQLDSLRKHASQIVSMRLSQTEPPLVKEVVEYMLDVDTHMWSIRRSKANVLRIRGVLDGLVAVLKWFDRIRNWKNPIATVLIHILFVILVLHPEFILPSFFLSLFLVGVWYHRWRPLRPPHMDAHLSCAENAHPDELDEEFDTFPTSRPADIVKRRYDRLRSASERIQTVVGDLAIQGERLQSLLTWRDPRATTLFIIFCLIAAIVLYVKPFYVVVIQTGFTVLSHPRFQHNLPLVPLNFFRRLPARTDCML